MPTSLNPLENLKAFQTLPPELATIIFILATSLAVLLSLQLLRKIVFYNLKKITFKQTFLPELISLLENLPRSFDWALTFFIILQFWQIPSAQIQKTLSALLLIFIAYQTITLLNKILVLTLKIFWFVESKTAKNKTVLSGLKLVSQIVLWSTGILLILTNLGFKVTTLVASLGLGGIAVAFALQNILADLFNSFAIYFDQPFKIGDFISIGSESGEIKKIGLKTTRIKTLRGEELVVANSNLMNQNIHNFKKMLERRISFNFGIEYATPSQKLAKIPKIVANIIQKIPQTRFARCHFTEFGDFSLNFEVVYFVLSQNYHIYRDTQQTINLEIKKEFEKAQIEMAFPTQKIFLETSRDLPLRPHAC